MKVGFFLTSVLAAVACRPPKEDPPPARVSDATLITTLATAERVVAGDLDDDGSPELVMVDAASMWVADATGGELARTRVPGGIQVLRLADVDGDGRLEILAAWGRSREHRDAAARIEVYRLAAGSLRPELVLAPPTSRHDVVDVLVVPGTSPPQLLLAYFESKYMVRIERARLDEGRWTTSMLHTVPMATSVGLGDVDGDEQIDLVVGRVYGDEPGGAGDAFVLRPDGARVPIPVTGGVRSLTLADPDGYGGVELLIGDGWNKSYGKLARARLTRAWWTGSGFQSELVEESPDEYTLWQILAVDVDGDGKHEIVTRGSGHVRLLSRERDQWEAERVASDCHELAALKLDTRPASTVVAICKDGARIVKP